MHLQEEKKAKIIIISVIFKRYVYNRVIGMLIGNITPC